MELDAECADSQKGKNEKSNKIQDNYINKQKLN